MDRTEEAKGLFNAGRAAFDAGRYQDALGYFQRSYALSGRAELLYNIAITYDRLRDDQNALDAYEKYLSLKPDAGNRGEVETRAAAIRSALERRQAEPAPEAQPAPTPAQTAAAAPPQPEPTQQPATAPEHAPAAAAHGGGVLTKWWFWTAVGAVVIGGATATAIALSGGSESPTPLEPTSGVIVTTLGRTP